MGYENPCTMSGCVRYDIVSPLRVSRLEPNSGSRFHGRFLQILFVIDDIFERHVKELMEKIESFQNNGRSCRGEIYHLVRLDTHIISIDPLRGFVNAPDFV